MAVTLAESALLLPEQSLQRGVIETFVQESPILARLPLLGIQGNAYAYNEEATLPGVAFRSVNEAYVESTGTVNQKTESLVILGGDADVDRFIQQTRSDLNDQRAVQTRMKVKAASYKFQDAFFNGDVAVDPKGYDGLKKRLVGAQVIDAATNGTPVIGASNTETFAFFDLLDELFAAVSGGPDVAFAPSALRAKILSAGRRIGGADVVVDDFNGKRIVTWNGVPILDPGEDLAGDAILPMDETMGTSSDTGSVYAIRFGEDEGDQAVTGLTNGGVMVDDLGQLQEKPAYRTRIEFYCGLAVFGGKAAARLRGIQAA